MTRELDPYDTGERTIPIVWNIHDPINGGKDRDRYGRVDFDNDEGSTTATVYVGRNKDGEYILHVDAHDDGLIILRDSVTAEEVRSALQRAHTAADGTSNDEEIEALQACRDLLEQITGITITDKED